LKTRVPLGFLAVAMLPTTAALADDKAACLDAATKGQRFRDTHKLVEAREQLRVCAAAVCPAVVQSDCANWLAEVESALPSVIVMAKNAAGADLLDVRVSVDGQPLVSALDGQAVPMNAGPHTFHFEGAAGRLDQQVVVVEGEKNQKVAVVLGETAPPAPNTPTAAPKAATPSEVPETPTSASSPWRTLGWVLGGAGVAGLGVGTVFGVIALDDKNSAGCNANGVCRSGTTSAIKSTSLVSDIGWIAGGILLASGTALVLFTLSATHGAEAGLRLAPTITASGAGVVAGGSW
jgi:hypothetical protein